MALKYDNDNIFAKVLTGKLPSIKIYEDDNTLVIMDIMPQIEGHILVIPKEQAITIYDLSDEACLACMKTVQVVGKALQKAMNANGTTILQQNGEKAGQSIPHFHFHIFPGSILALKGHAVELADTQKLEHTASKIISYL